MLIPSQAAVERYTYAGVNVLDIPFHFFGLESIHVQASDGNEDIELKKVVDLVYNVDYTVAGHQVGEYNNIIAFDYGTVTLTPVGVAKIAPMWTVAVYRLTSISQLFSYTELDNFPAKSHENALAKLTLICQELNSFIDRALVADPSSQMNSHDILMLIYSLRDELQALSKHIHEYVEAAQADIDTRINTAISTMSNLITNATNTLNALVTNTTNEFNTIISTTTTNMEALVETAQDTIDTKVADAESYISTVVSSALSTLAGKMSDYLAAVAAAMSGALLSSGAYNERFAWMLTQGYEAGDTMELPFGYFPTRKILNVSFNGTQVIPKDADYLGTGFYHYEEVGTDPNEVSMSIKLNVPVSSGVTVDIWVVTSAAGRNIDAQQALLDLGQQALSETVAERQAAEAARDRAEEGAFETEQDKQEVITLKTATAAIRDEAYEVLQEITLTNFEGKRAAWTLTEDIDAGDDLELPAPYVPGHNSLLLTYESLPCVPKHALADGDTSTIYSYTEVDATHVTLNFDAKAGNQFDMWSIPPTVPATAKATNTTLGVVKGKSALGYATIDSDGAILVPGIVPATNDDYGSVIGVESSSDYLAIDDGKIIAPPVYVLPVASTALGGVVSGDGSTTATIDSSGKINMLQYTLPIATASALGGVKSGNGSTTAAIDGSGYITLPAAPVFVIPVATSTVLGGVKSGDGTTTAAINSTTGLISLPTPPTPYTLPVATTTALGGVLSVTDTYTNYGKAMINADGTINLHKPYRTQMNVADYLGADNYTWEQLLNACVQVRAEFGVSEQLQIPLNRVSNPTANVTIRGLTNLHIQGAGTLANLTFYDCDVTFEGAVQINNLTLYRSLVWAGANMTIVQQLAADRMSNFTADGMSTFIVRNISATHNSSIRITAAYLYLGPVTGTVRPLNAEFYSSLYCPISNTIVFYSTSNAAVDFMRAYWSGSIILTSPNALSISGTTPSSIAIYGEYNSTSVLSTAIAVPNVSFSNGHYSTAAYL